MTDAKLADVPPAILSTTLEAVAWIVTEEAISDQEKLRLVRDMVSRWNIRKSDQ